MKLPGIIILARRDTRRDEATVGVRGTRPMPVALTPGTSPPPQQDSLFYYQGRDAAHQWPRTPNEPNLHLGIPDIQSHMAPWFLFPKVPSALVVGQPRGAQLPVAPRPNIDAPASGLYGTLAALRPDPTYSSVYAKLGV